MPFCPSFEPCAKLTPVQVRIKRPRIHHGGGALPSGAFHRRGAGITYLAASNSRADSTNPATGENSNERPTPSAWFQSTPLVPFGPPMSWFIRPTPRIEPISACELELGMPKYQVPTFQIIAAMSRAKTMANPAELPTWRMSSTGKSEMMPKATAPLDAMTPRKLNTPDHTTAT